MIGSNAGPKPRLVWTFFILAAVAAVAAAVLLTVRGITSPRNVHIALLAAAVAATFACAGCLETAPTEAGKSGTVRLARWVLRRWLYFMQVAALALAVWCIYLLFWHAWIVHPQ